MCVFAHAVSTVKPLDHERIDTPPAPPSDQHPSYARPGLDTRVVIQVGLQCYASIQATGSLTWIPSPKWLCLAYGA
jgi:hypothetical protein